MSRIEHVLDTKPGHLALVGVGLYLNAANKILDVVLQGKTEGDSLVAIMLDINIKLVKIPQFRATRCWGNRMNFFI